MKYLTNVFKESLRLYPPVGFFARESKEETTMRKTYKKKGAGIVVAPWFIHRHEDFGKILMSLIHQDMKIKQIFKKEHIYLLEWRKICIGQGFAMQESILILSNILRTYKLELKEDFVPDVVGRLTIRSANGMYIKNDKRK